MYCFILCITYYVLLITCSQAMQFIYWSRNGIMLSELLSLCDISITMWCYIYHCLHSKHILMEIGGLITFTHNQACCEVLLNGIICTQMQLHMRHLSLYIAHTHSLTHAHTHTHTHVRAVHYAQKTTFYVQYTTHNNHTHVSYSTD